MLGIKVGSEFLDLKGVTISVTLKSPVFFRDEASYIFNFTFPATDHNKKVLKFFNRIQSFSTEAVEIKGVQIHFSGVHLWNGTLKVSYGRPGEFEAVIGLEKGDFNYTAKNTKLTDLCFDDIQFSLEEKAQPNSILNIIDKSWPEANFAYFPVYNPGLFSGSWWDQFYNFTIDRFHELVFSVDPHLLYFAGPFSYFRILLQHNLIYNYTDPDGTAHTYPEDWQRRMDQYKNISDRFSNALQESPNYIYHFYWWFKWFVDFWGLGPQLASQTRLCNDFWSAGWVNYIDIDFLNHTKTPGRYIVPFPYLCEVMQKSISTLGYFKGKDFISDDAELSTLAIVTMNIANTQIGLINPPSTLYTVKLNEHLPEITIADLFKSLQEFFNCSIIPKRDKSVDIIKNVDILTRSKVIEFSDNVEFIEDSVEKKAFNFHLNVEGDSYFSANVKQEGIQRFPRLPDVWSVADLPDPWINPAEINVVCYVGDHQAYYITTFEEGNLVWIEYARKDADYLADQNYPDARSVDVSLGYLLKQVYGWYAGSNSHIFLQQGYDLPYFEFARCDIKGNGALHAISFDMEYQAAPFKLMFYRGMKHFAPNPMANADQLPHGSPDDTYLGSPIPGLNYSLLWDGPNGIYKRFWGKWVYWLNNRAKQVKIKKQLALKDLLNFDWTAHHHIHGPHYLIKEVRFDMDEVIHPAEMDIVKL